MEGPSVRKLAAIMFTDVVGYTALMAESEAAGLRARERHRQAVRPLVEAYRGERSREIIYMVVDSALDPIRDDPRFADFVRRAGIPQSGSG